MLLPIFNNLSIYTPPPPTLYPSTYTNIYLSLYRSICLIRPIHINVTVNLLVYLRILLSIYLPIYLSIYLSIYLFTYLSISLSICLSPHNLCLLFSSVAPVSAISSLPAALKTKKSSIALPVVVTDNGPVDAETVNEMFTYLCSFLIYCARRRRKRKTRSRRWRRGKISRGRRR